MYNIICDGCMMLVMGFIGKIVVVVKECYINVFNWMVEQLNWCMVMGEELQYCYVIKEMCLKLKGMIGSCLMNEWKKEKCVLEFEYEYIMQVMQLELLIG